MLNHESISGSSNLPVKLCRVTLAIKSVYGREGLVTLITNILVGLVALLHCYFLVLEMFLWDRPTGLRVFNLSREEAAATKVLAANQGLYNGFLAAGLVWGLILGTEGYPVKVFFLCCIVIAGLYGAMSVGRKILFIQAMPAAIGLALLFLFQG